MSLANSQSQVKPILFQLRNRIRFNRALLIASNTLLIGVLLYLFGFLSMSVIIENDAFDEILYQRLIFMVVAISIVYLLWSLKQNNYLKFNFSQVTEHLNRTQPEYQESAQLLIQPVEKLSELQLIQYRKILKLLEQESANQIIYQYAPTIRNRLIVNLIIIFFSLVVTSRIPQWFATSDSIKDFTFEESLIDTPSLELPSIVSTHITIIPPNYTNQSVSINQTSNLKIIENSVVEWKYRFSNSDYQYFWIDPFTQPQSLVLKEDGFFSYSKTISQTGIYRIAYQLKEGDIALTNLGEVNTIEVLTDSPPKIQIVEPQQTLLEISSNNKPEFNLIALVKDDYSIASTRILASVAKGSGEAVKFRDLIFDFDRFDVEESSPQFASSRRYTKRWLLSDLQMEPGDEVYFNIVATDNKQPQPQVAKSNTIIVRWLDKKVKEFNRDGIKIGFIQEYFRSQRQIIIETEQLIADRRDLMQLDVRLKSEELGHSQRDLKEKYGQFLGDEFDEGESAPVDFDDEHHSTEESNESNEKVEVDHSNQHQDHYAPESATGDLHQLISQFGHNHGGTEVTALSNKDPKSWMKKAVAEMWQAELHLMLAKPEKAIVFEYNAYHFLKLARQADRIYTKRLGFEPPPVSEDNRLKGKITDVSSYTLSIVDLEDSEATQQLISKVFQHLGNPQDGAKISEQTKNDFISTRTFLLNQSKSRTTLINYVATVEKIILEQTTTLSNCSDCVGKLRQKLWQLSAPAVSNPLVNQQFNLLDRNLQKQYQQSISNLQESDVEVEKDEDHD